MKSIIGKKGQPLTFLILIVGILMSCESPYEELISKNDNGDILSTYTIRKKDGVKHGKYQLYIDGKLSEEGIYTDGKEDGMRKFLFESGKTQVEEIYELGKLLSKKTYYENGKMESEGQYDAAITMAGEWKYYYKNGQLEESVTFKNNAEDGAFTEYYQNGNIKAEGTYVPLTFGLETVGKEQGLLKEYNEKGELIRKKECEIGRCKTIWTADGE